MIEWKEYKVGEVFNIETSTGTDKIKFIETKIKNDNSINYITRTALNNGINCYIIRDEKMKINLSKCLTVGIENNCFFYQQDDFVCGQNISILRNKNLNKYNSLFIITILNDLTNNQFQFSTQGLTKGRLEKLLFLLPTHNNQIAWDLMDRYIRRLESKILDKKKINVENELLNKSVDTSTWKEFNFFDIFDKNYQIGDSKKITTLEGDIALVSAGESNNGIDSFVKYNEKNKLFNENQITLAKNGSVGTMNYQNQKFYATSDIMVLKLKDYELNKYIALFLKVFCEREFKLNYSWSNKITLKVLEKTKIKLPTTQNGEIDWQYMEDFMKNVEKEAIIN